MSHLVGCPACPDAQSWKSAVKERGKLEHLVDIRPVYHRLPDRSEAHVILCWLAMPLIRVTENETGETWRQMKKSLATLKVGNHRTAEGEVWQTSTLRPEVKSLFERLKLKLPPRFYAMKPAKGLKA